MEGMKEKIKETLAQLDELLDKESTLLAHQIDQEQSDELVEAQSAISQLVTILREEAPRELSSRIKRHVQEDNRKRLNRDSQAVFRPSAEIYGNNSVLRLYK